LVCWTSRLNIKLKTHPATARPFDSFTLLIDPQQRQQLTWVIASKTVANRPGRSEPRRVKRKPKPLPLLHMARGLYKNGA
jgi:hypothetical protein